MKPNWPPRIDSSSYADAPPFFRRFLEPFSKMVARLSQILSNGLTFADNFKAAVLSRSMTHGTAVTIGNPLSSKPVGVLALACDAQVIDSLGWSVDSTGDLSLTARFVSGSGTASVTLLVVGG